LVETITDAVSVHSIKKGEYARRVAEGEAIGTVSLMDHFVAVRPFSTIKRIELIERRMVNPIRDDLQELNETLSNP
jgi:hypothetical protein